MVSNFKITENFTLYEMTDSDDHPELVDENRESLLESYDRMINVDELCVNLLQPIRDYFGKTIITRGYNNEALARAIYASLGLPFNPNTQHLLGQAADFVCSGIHMANVYDSIVDRKYWRSPDLSFLKWHQLIYYPKKNFIHISSPTGSDDMQAWIEGE